MTSIFARRMARADARRVSEMHEAKHGVAGMIGSLDCMHVGWKNCPVAWQGSQMGKSGKPTIVLEAVADYNLWFWHSSFGWPGSLNVANIQDTGNISSRKRTSRDDKLQIKSKTKQSRYKLMTNYTT